MLKGFISLVRFYLFWLLFFALERLVFLIYFSDKLQEAPFSEIIKSFFYGLRMDASMAGYVSLIPLLIFLIRWFFPRLPFRAYNAKAYVNILIVLFSLLTVINFNIYREWGSKINSKALDFFFDSPNEALASGSSSPIILSLLIFVALVVTSIALSRVIIDYKLPGKNIMAWPKLVVVMVSFFFTFLTIRGGLDASPINQSMVYYSNRPLLNHAAINTEWNLVQDLLNQNFSNKNPYKYFADAEAVAIVNELYRDNPDSHSKVILNTSRPNIVLIILESFTADVVEKLGGEEGVAPNMEKLISRGLFFDHIYASGDRTDKGLVAILSAFPSQATRSIIKFNDKQEKLPSISQKLNKNGYLTSFYYGGQSEFFNIKSYLLSHDFNKLVDKSAFQNTAMSSWGVFDHVVFERNLSDLKISKQPFFSTVLTLSNHEPFQLPSPPRFSGDDASDKFRSTAYYTDSSLGEYLRQAATQAWYKNTLFVIIADHGHRLPKNSYEIYDPGRFRIPLLLYGDALKEEFKGKVINKVGSQTDLAVTLLKQLNIPANEFVWSKDLLDSEKEGFSFFSWDNGFGFAAKDQVISFDNPSERIIFKKDNAQKTDSTLTRFGKAYMQRVFQTFLDY